MCWMTQEAKGSSPRIRGEYVVEDLHFVVLGIIPANTGRITPSVQGGRGLSDHPREYGENRMSLRKAS